MPGSGSIRAYDIPANGSVGITLPFTLTIKGRSYTDARIGADGYVSFPEAGALLGTPNRCLANLLQPPQAILGWWADLDQSAGHDVITFWPAPDRFVIEYDDVPSALGVSPAYTVKFQIVLYQSGMIGLNYWHVPSAAEIPPAVTVGVTARDDRFHNQVACVTQAVELGTVPTSFQSIVFKPEDIY